MKITYEFYKTEEQLPDLNSNILILGKGYIDGKHIDVNGNVIEEQYKDGDWHLLSHVMDKRRLDHLTKYRTSPSFKYWAHFTPDEIVE